MPNFSEGRDPTKVAAIEASIVSAGVEILRVEMDPDHNRAVITFAGRPDAVSDAAFRAIEKAGSIIDMRAHRGVHPRVGASDVVPFVPIDGVTLEDCVRLAHKTGASVWTEVGIPVYFYEAAAIRPECARLENVRRGQFEGVRLKPDLGGPALHPSGGAVVIGARNLLVAFNINLATQDVGIASAIARKIRTSSGGFPAVKAIGVGLASRKCVQVSINFTDFEQTPLRPVFEAVRIEAELRGAGVMSSELIGLIPRKALEDAGGAAPLRIENFNEAWILENALQAAGLT